MATGFLFLQGEMVCFYLYWFGRFGLVWFCELGHCGYHRYYKPGHNQQCVLVATLKGSLRLASNLQLPTHAPFDTLVTGAGRRWSRASSTMIKAEVANGSSSLVRTRLLPPLATALVHNHHPLLSCLCLAGTSNLPLCQMIMSRPSPLIRDNWRD